MTLNVNNYFPEFKMPTNLAGNKYINGLLLLLFFALSAIYFNMTANAWNNIIEGRIDECAIKKANERKGDKYGRKRKNKDKDEDEDDVIRRIKDDLKFNYAISLTFILLISVGVTSFYYNKRN